LELVADDVASLDDLITALATHDKAKSQDHALAQARTHKDTII
jgi:hypothetical protein